MRTILIAPILLTSGCASKPIQLMSNEKAKLLDQEAQANATPESKFGDCLNRVKNEDWGPTARTAFCTKRMEIEAKQD